MGRSLKKGPFVAPRLLQKITKAKQNKDTKPIKTWYRSCVIIPEMVGMTFAVHNGRKFLDVYVIENMVGHKLGEFSPTRTFKIHGGKMAKEQAAAAAAAQTAQVKKAQDSTAKPKK